MAIEMCRDGESSVSVSIQEDASVRLTAMHVVLTPPSHTVLSVSDLSPDDAQRLGEALIRAAARARNYPNA